MLLQAEGIAALQAFRFRSQCIGRLQGFKAPFAGVKQLGDCAFHRIPEQHYHACRGEEVVDATRHVGVEQVKGSYLTTCLVGFGVREVVSVPVVSCFVVQIEEMNFLAGRQINVRVLFQQAMQCGGAAFLGAETEELREGGCHSADVAGWRHCAAGAEPERLHGVKSGSQGLKAICPHVKIEP